MCPRARVEHLTDENPQYPHEHPDFWHIWQMSLRKFFPIGPDFVFASEDYGFKLAEILGARYIPVDHDRELVPVSASAIREDPMKYWEFIPPVVRPYFVRRVCIVGAESTGKSVLASRLAKHYHTVFVGEYARGLISLHNNQVTPDLFPMITRGHLASEAALARQANRVLISDTDLITTMIWSEILLGHCPAWLKELAGQSRYDLYLLADADAPWIADPQRFLPDGRHDFQARLIQELTARGRPYVTISGSWDDRFQQAVRAVDRLLAGTGYVDHGD